MRKIHSLLVNNRSFLIIWCFVSAFGTYFCMYAFRKSFSSGLYTGYELAGFSYKTVLVITQVFGYMISKFIGIKIIAELRKPHRIWLIISLILFSELALIGFGFVPYPYNFIFLFFNGLPLGMVWGIIFSFLEGRRITEFIVSGLCLNLVIGSGILKSIYISINMNFLIDEFWMPALIGLFFLPFFLFFVWMLNKIPNPTQSDEVHRTKRVPMSKKEKSEVITKFGFPLLLILLIYTLLTALRDFRDNFYLEIYKQLGEPFDQNTFAQNELIVGLIVVLILISVGSIRNNKKALKFIYLLVFLGIICCGIVTWLFENNKLTIQQWMIFLGISLFLPYLVLQTLYFERLISVFKIKANAGFFVCICDASGYLGSVFLMCYKEFGSKDLSWVLVLKQMSYFISLISFFCLIGSYLILKTQSKIPKRTKFSAA
jgi:MFS family permease